MTKQEIDAIVSTGAEIKRVFYTKSLLHELDGKRITQVQYDGILKRFNGKLSFELLSNGMTKHIHKLKDIYL